MTTLTQWSVSPTRHDSAPCSFPTINVKEEAVEEDSSRVVVRTGGRLYGIEYSYILAQEMKTGLSLRENCLINSFLILATHFVSCFDKRP